MSKQFKVEVETPKTTREPIPAKSHADALNLVLTELDKSLTAPDKDDDGYVWEFLRETDVEPIAWDYRVWFRGHETRATVTQLDKPLNDVWPL